MANSMNHPRWKSWALAFGFWTLLALSYAVSNCLSRLSEGEMPMWGSMATWYLTGFWMWMLLVPVLAWLGRSTANRGWGGLFLVHLPACVVTALAHVFVQTSVFWVAFGTTMKDVHTFAEYFRAEFVFDFYMALLTYWIIFAVLRGMESRRHLRHEQLRSAQLESQLAHSYLQSLRMQLQPHFLFNTLNAISALALADPLQARLMIARLGDLLRLTLEEHHAQQVPLARELEFVRCYLDIQRIRFRDRLETRFDVSDDALRAAVPSMILQPLVENALRHGLSDRTSRGNLSVEARREDEHLRVCIEDDGLGLPPGGGIEGVGLGNTRARLGALYGELAQLKLSKREGGGTCAELRIPFRAYVEAVAA